MGPDGKRKKKTPWSNAETQALVAGHAEHGNKWTKILTENRDKFDQCRTSIDLKDKMRVINKRPHNQVTKNKAAAVASRPAKRQKRPKKEYKPYDGDVKFKLCFGTKTKKVALQGTGLSTVKELLDYAHNRELNTKMTPPEGFKNLKQLVVTIAEGKSPAAGTYTVLSKMSTNLGVCLSKKEYDTKPFLWIVLKKRATNV